MEKLYRAIDDETHYWEFWEQAPGDFIIHWGVVGAAGETKTIKSGFFSPAHKKVLAEARERIDEGYLPVPAEEHSLLIIEYSVNGMGSEADLEKRHALEDRMNELLGWTGLGACDGGSIGTGSMEVANSVVDPQVAEKVIRANLADTEFADFTRIHVES